MRDPHKVFEKIRAAGHRAVLLESGDVGWSFIGIVNEKVKVPEGEAGLAFMREFLKKHHRVQKPGEPPFRQGFVGFLSYDLGEWWMGIEKRSKIKDQRSKRLQAPEAYFVYVDKVIAFFPNVTAPHQHTKTVHANRTRGAHKIAPVSNLTFNQYSRKLGKIKNYLYSGHTYQVNFSQRFEISYKGEAFELYKKVTAINPSPFQFFLETSDFAIVSNSPERLMRMQAARRAGRRGQKFIIETRPIKGTVPRGKTLQEDKKNIQKLLASEKEASELAMIVDLERNDIGKICVPGTVEVTEERTVEKYSHVIHTAANIRGVMDAHYDWYDALRAVFPGGSITGCPKKRTMEIIAELEEYPRGIYCGAAGFIDISGACDFNIMIRTILLQKNGKHRKITFNSGGGIVADSRAKNEYEEALQKAGALISATLK